MLISVHALRVLRDGAPRSPSAPELLWGRRRPRGQRFLLYVRTATPFLNVRTSPGVNSVTAQGLAEN